MAATEHKVRLFRRGVDVKRAEARVYLDPGNAARLREVLEDLARANHGGRQLDLTQWRIEVWQTARPVHVVARVQVDSAGRTEVKR